MGFFCFPPGKKEIISGPSDEGIRNREGNDTFLESGIRIDPDIFSEFLRFLPAEFLSDNIQMIRNMAFDKTSIPQKS